MHFITFPVASTNIFPLVNSSQGGQLATEYNLKSREMVMTNPDVKFAIGPSFLHSDTDFQVKLLEDTEVANYDANQLYKKGDYCTYNNNTYVCIVDITAAEPFTSSHWSKSSISSSILQIDPGRAVINGHYVETLAPMLVDLNLANIELAQASKPALFGDLSIGIKSYFSTETTMAGAMLVENEDNMYVGIQIVIEESKKFKVPGDVGCRAETERDNVTADIKLADFTYINGAVSSASITPNPNVTRYIDSRRIADFASILDDTYVTSSSVSDNILYTFSGKSKNWCDSTGSLMTWDKAYNAHRQYLTPAQIAEIEATYGDEANFYTDPTTGNVSLVVPHKQIDTNFDPTSSQTYLYYLPKILNFPTANYSASTPGIVTSAYTNKIKEIASVINTYKQFTNGKQIGYIDILNVADDGKTDPELPTDLSGPGYNVGDYILVREDYTVGITEDDGSNPSTMYFVLPGDITAIAWGGTSQPSGIRVGNPYILKASEGAPVPTEQIPSAADLLDIFSYTSYKGTVGDYFEIDYYNEDETEVTVYYYPVTAAGAKSLSSAILLTGGVPLATETQIGGFYNASTDIEYTDAGYVYLDDTGHLRLRDYELLRSGAMAYQLGSSLEITTNQTLASIQSFLDELVNSRVAFYTNAVLTSTPPVIDIKIPLPYDEEGVLNIYNLDSRFGTAVYLHFIANDPTKDYSKITINISDCEKVRIDSAITTIPKGPMINIFRSCLYYDAGVINYIKLGDSSRRATLFSDPTFTGFNGLTLWYARFSLSDPDITVNGMEIMQPNVDSAAQDVVFWDENMPNDNHFGYALRSVTLSNVGTVIACSLYVANISTATVNPNGRIIIGGDFTLPQGSNLNYPEACITNALRITGTFTTAYPDNTGTKWITTETSFTATSGVFDKYTGLATGTIAFNADTETLDAIYTANLNKIKGWEVGDYHIFYGGVTVQA